MPHLIPHVCTKYKRFSDPGSRREDQGLKLDCRHSMHFCMKPAERDRRERTLTKVLPVESTDWPQPT